MSKEAQVTDHTKRRVGHQLAPICEKTEPPGVAISFRRPTAREKRSKGGAIMKSQTTPRVSPPPCRTEAGQHLPRAEAMFVNLRDLCLARLFQFPTGLRGVPM